MALAEPDLIESVLDATGRVALAVALVGAAIGRGRHSWESAVAELTTETRGFIGHPYANTFKAMELGTLAAERDLEAALAREPGHEVAEWCHRRLQQSAHLISPGRSEAVDLSTTLHRHFFPLKDLVALDRLGPCSLTPLWVVDNKSPHCIRTITGQTDWVGSVA